MYARAPQAYDRGTMAMGRSPAAATAKLGVCPSLRRQRYAASHAAKITRAGPPVTRSAHQAKLYSLRLLREVRPIGFPCPPVVSPDHDDVHAGRQPAPRQQPPTHDVSLTGDLLPRGILPSRPAENALRVLTARVALWLYS